VTEWVPRSARISFGLRHLSDSFLEGRVLQKNVLDINMASNLEFWSRNSSGISGKSVSMLSFGNVLPELLV